MKWLNETEEQLDQLNAEATVNDPEKIKQRYASYIIDENLWTVFVHEILNTSLLALNFIV